jgi:hypothetical protein
MFGPCIQGLESSEDVEDEVTGLLFSLLGIYSRSTYDPNHSSSASRTHQSSARPSRNALKQLFRRDEDNNSFFPLPPAKVQRWLWLMQCLYEQSVGRS